MTKHGVFENELTDHTITLNTGPDGFYMDLVCPDNCPDMVWHQDDWADNGGDSIISVDEDVVIGIIPVNPEIVKIKRAAPNPDEADEELWFQPVVPAGD